MGPIGVAAAVIDAWFNFQGASWFGAACSTCVNCDLTTSVRFAELHALEQLTQQGVTCVTRVICGCCPVLQITNPSYMVPSSFGSATSVRVANLLGGGLPRKARTAAG